MKASWRLLGCGCLLFLSVLAQAAELTAAQSLQTYFSSLNSLEGQFRQIVRDESGRVSQTVSGHFVLARPGKLRWKTEEELIVSDGQKLWHYDLQLEQVTIQKLDLSQSSVMALFLLSRTENLPKFYVIKKTQQQAKTTFSLKPKNPDNPFSNLRVTLKNNQLKTIEAQDKMGFKTEWQLTEVKKNARIHGRPFSFSPPKGVDVISVGD